jgi:hypothetical protein
MNLAAELRKQQLQISAFQGREYGGTRRVLADDTRRNSCQSGTASFWDMAEILR